MAEVLDMEVDVAWKCLGDARLGMEAFGGGYARPTADGIKRFVP